MISDATLDDGAKEWPKRLEIIRSINRMIDEDEFLPFVPPNDSAFDSWQEGFLSHIRKIFEAVGIPAQDAEALHIASQEWRSSFASYRSAQSMTHAARNIKDTKREKLERMIAKVMRALRSGTKTAEPVPEIAGIFDGTEDETDAFIERPLLHLDPTEPHRHLIHWGDSPSRPENNKKPEHVLWMELYMSVDNCPDFSEYMYYVSSAPTSPYVAELAQYEGRRIFWAGRYRSVSGFSGPWSDVIHATVRKRNA